MVTRQNLDFPAALWQASRPTILAPHDPFPLAPPRPDRALPLRARLSAVLPAARGERRGGAGPRRRYRAFGRRTRPSHRRLSRRLRLLPIAAWACCSTAMGRGAYRPGFSPSPASAASALRWRRPSSASSRRAPSSGLASRRGLMAGYKASSLWVPAERRSLVNAAIMATGAIGIVFATEPTEYLVSLIGWRRAFLVFAALTLACAIFIFLAVPKRESEVDAGAALDAIAPVAAHSRDCRCSGGSCPCWRSPPACRSRCTGFGRAHGFAM